jgi:hypothetical protein
VQWFNLVALAQLPGPEISCEQSSRERRLYISMARTSEGFAISLWRMLLRWIPM